MPQLRAHNTNPADAPGFFLAQGASRLFDLVTGPWAITPAMLTELQALYMAHLGGEKIDKATIEAVVAGRGGSQARDYEVVDGVAILSAQGAIAPKANLMTQICGGTSAQILQRDLAQALDDARVDAIVLAIDSPGGSVFGTPDLARAIYGARGRKPIVAHSDGMMASAAYWFGAAADSVYISGETVTVGSIGVVARHMNRQTKAFETEITAGKYKRIASDTGPLTKEGAAYLQAQVDYIYSIFVGDAATFRGVSVDQVLEDMADGRVFIGQQAIDAGLVDGVASLSDLVASLASDPQSVTQRTVKPKSTTKRAKGPTADAEHAPAAAAGAAAAQDSQPEPVPLVSQSNHEENPMDAQALERDHPALYASLQKQFRAEGAAAEVARVKAVREQSLPGHEALIEQMAADGKTTGAEAAAAIVAAEKAALQAAATAHKNDAPEPAPAGGAATEATEKTPEALAAEATALAAKEGISIVAAFKRLGVK